MFRDNILDILHTTIANFHCVPVEEFMKLVCWWEVPINKTEETASYVGLDLCAERRVEPNNIAVSMSPCLLWGFTQDAELVIIIAVF